MRRQDDTAFKIQLLIVPTIFHTQHTHTPHAHHTHAHTHTHTHMLASLSQPNVACPIQHLDNCAREPANEARAARPPDAEILSVWEDGYMRGQGREECAEVCLCFFVVGKAKGKFSARRWQLTSFPHYTRFRYSEEVRRSLFFFLLSAARHPDDAVCVVAIIHLCVCVCVRARARVRACVYRSISIACQLHAMPN